MKSRETGIQLVERWWTLIKNESRDTLRTGKSQNIIPPMSSTIMNRNEASIETIDISVAEECPCPVSTESRTPRDTTDYKLRVEHAFS
jgi:hypothetical protein